MSVTIATPAFGGRRPKPGIATTTTTAPATTTTTKAPTTTTVAPSTTPTTAAPASASSPAELTYFYMNPADGNLDTLAANFNSYVLSRSTESTRDSLRAKGVTGPIVVYILANEIMDPGSPTAQPWLNNVAWNPGDFASISANHPDWFLLDNQGRRITDPDLPGFYYMDPANSGWRQFWLSRAQYAQQSLGWNGVFLDCVDLSINRFTRHGQYLQKYTTDAAWASAQQGFLAYMYPWFQSNKRPMWANLGEYNGDMTTLNGYLNYLDGGMDEAFAADWSTGYLSTSDWQTSLSKADALISRGKKAILVSQGPQTDNARETFTFASYLLVDGAASSFRYANYNYYNQAWVYSNYKAALGTATGARYNVNGVWRRDFTGGYVTVDPSTHVASIVTN